MDSESLLEQRIEYLRDQLFAAQERERALREVAEAYLNAQTWVELHAAHHKARQALAFPSQPEEEPR